MPQIPISCPSICTATIVEDVGNYRRAGAAGIDLWEHKFENQDDGAIKDAIPDPFFAEPAALSERPAALIKAINWLARFNPVGILVTTGEGWDGWYDVEVFSDSGLFGNDYPASVWSRSAAGVPRDRVEKVMHLCNTMNDAG